MMRKQILALLLSATLLMGIMTPVYATEGNAVEAATETEPNEMIEEELTPKEEKENEEPDVVEQLTPVEPDTASVEPAEIKSLGAEDIVSIPDAKLKQVLLEKHDKNKDGQLSKGEMEAIESLELHKNMGGLEDILDLTGLEYCVNIKKLQINFINCQNIEKIKEMKQLEELDLRGCNISDISMVSNWPNLLHLGLAENKIQDISALSQLKKLTSLQLDKNEVSDISVLSNLQELQSLGLSYNKVSDISTLNKLVKIKRLDLTQNMISDISVLTYLTKIQLLYLSHNKITDISALENMNALQHLELAGNSEIRDISILELHKNRISFVDITGNANINKEYLLQTFLNTNIRVRVMVGNEIGFPLVDLGWLRSIKIDEGVFQPKDVAWDVEDTKVARVTENLSIIGIAVGMTTLKGTIGKTTTKSFALEVVGLEGKVVEASKNTSEISKLLGDACAVLDSKKVLWSINNDKTEKVKTGVKSYIANIVYGKSTEESWGRYYALDTSNSLWECNKSNIDASYTTDKIFTDVKKYTDAHALLNNGKLYELQDENKLIGENIEDYTVNYDYTTKKYVVENGILNKNKEFVNRETGEVYLEGIDAVAFSFDGYSCLKGSTLYVFRNEGTEIKSYGTVEGVKKIVKDFYGGTSQFVKTDGSFWNWSFSTTTANTLDLTKKSDTEPLYFSYNTLLDANHILYLYDNQGNVIEKKENVKEVFRDLLTCIITNDNIYMEYVAASKEWKTIAVNVKKVLVGYGSMGSYYLTSDNMLYQVTVNGVHNEVMADVRDVTTTGGGGSDCYIVRMDNSVWKYGAFSDGNGQPYLVKEGDASAPPVEGVFKDVKQSEWFNDSVQYVYDGGIMKGLTDTTFGPVETLARAQFAVILYRLNGEPDIAYTAKFKDVPDGQWYTKAVLWANSIGVVNGYTSTGLFGTGDPINREQMAVMMHRYATYKQYDTSKKADFSKFADASAVNGFAKDAMQWAVGAVIITGKDNGTKIDPQGNAIRAECATIIMRFMEACE